ncbi:hypothetical protein [Sphingomonas profundi]|uniref:hypothetical protein n=1 Tax=Alterirhizorhabdus profundi TaxID=2681549 RepID=UPI0012E955E3|nr:hypothetical protein [Sphingomonas profundi]
MAYLDSDTLFAAAATRAIAAPQAVPAAFSALEWSVIALARNESLGSLSQPGRMSRAVRSLFGLGEASPLADPRLEALRRMAVWAWHRGFAVPLSEIDRFLAAGFTEADIETLVVSVTGIRVGRRERSLAA